MRFKKITMGSISDLNKLWFNALAIYIQTQIKADLDLLVDSDHTKLFWMQLSTNHCKHLFTGYDAAIARPVEKTKNGDADSKVKESGPVQHAEERNEGKSEDHPRDIGLIVGIVVIGIISVAAVTTMVVVIRWRRQQRSQLQGSSNQYAQVRRSVCTNLSMVYYWTFYYSAP